MFTLLKLNSVLNRSFNQLRYVSTPACSSYLNSNGGFNGSLYIPNLDKNGKFEPLTNPDLTINYKCPSMKSFQLPLTDIKITDVLKRQIMNLPEINKNKIVDDPLLEFQIEQKCPEIFKRSVPMSCNRPMLTEIGWRKRKMNKHKRKKYLKKMFYVIKRRGQAKEKRYNNILALYRNIQAKKVEAFDPYKYITRELEKAKFFGYQCDNVYEKTRETVMSLNTFDEKYTKTFVNKRLPVHLRPENLKLKNSEN
jgi:hypothetical protein